MDLVFLLGAIVCAAGLLVLVFMPEVHLAALGSAARRRRCDGAGGRR